MRSSASLSVRINLRAVAALLVATGILVGAVFGLHAAQAKRLSRGLREQAEVAEAASAGASEPAEKDRQAELAADYYAQYLGMVPENAAARERYGLLVQGLAKRPQDFARAFLILSYAVEQDPTLSRARRAVAKLALEMGRYSDARDHLLTLLEKSPDDAEVMEWLGRCEAGDHRFPEAMDWCARAAERAPDRLGVYLLHAAILRDRLKQPAQATKLIEAMVETNHGSLPAQLEAARYYMAQAQLDAAEKHVHAAVAGAGAHDPDTLWIAANLDIACGRRTDADRHLREGLAAAPNDGRIRRGLARLTLQAGKTKEALDYLTPAAEAALRQPDELWDFGNTLLDAGAWERATQVTDRLEKNPKAGASAACLRARLAIRRQEWMVACQTLQKAVASPRLSAEQGKYIYSLLGDCYGQLANPDQQMANYRRSLEFSPHWLPARRGLAAALAAQGKTEQAIVEYRLAARDAPELGIELARQLIVRALRLPPAERQWNEVEAVLRGLPERLQKSVDAEVTWAELLAAQGQKAAALARAEQARDHAPKEVLPWLFLARLAEAQGPPAALAILDEAEKQIGARPEWQTARIRIWVRTGGPEAVKQLHHLEASRDRLPVAERDVIAERLADALAAVGDRPAAEAIWKRLAESSPQNFMAQFQLLETALNSGQETEICRRLDDLKRSEGDGALSAFGETAYRLLLARKGDKAALAMAHQSLERAESLRPTWAAISTLAGEICELDGHPDKAVDKYLAAIDRGESRPAVYGRALQLLYAYGRLTEADALVEKLPAQSLAAPGVGRAAAQVLATGVDQDRPDAAANRKRAFEMAQRSVAGESQDYRAYLWLGQIALKTGHLAEAEKAFRRARELGEAAPETWAALILFLAPTDPSKAATEMAEAERRLTADSAHLALAACQEALGRPDQAEKHYRAALAANPNDTAALYVAASFYVRAGEMAKAEPLFRTLIDPHAKAAESVVAAARRDLAIALTAGGDYRRFHEAVALLDENAKGSAESDADRRARAFVLSTRPEHRKEAIRLLEGLSGSKASLPPAMQFMLARLYEADRAWPQARGRMLSLLREQPKDATLLTWYAAALLRHQDAAEALAIADRLAEVAPKAPGTVEIKAQALKALGRTSEAFDLAKAYAAAKDSRQDFAAALFDDLGHPAEAEALYRAYASTPKGPDAVLALASFLARHDRVSEALEILERAWRDCPPEAVARTCVKAIQGGRGTADQVRRVEAWIDTAIRAHPDRLGLLMTLAEMKLDQGNNAQAAELYRRVTSMSPNNVVALNNLGYVLGDSPDGADEALKLVGAAIAAAGPAAELLDTRAVILMKAGRLEPALDDLKQALAQTPTAALYLHLAEALRLSKDSLAAATAFHKAIDQGLTEKTVAPADRATYQRLRGEFGAT